MMDEIRKGLIEIGEKPGSKELEEQRRKAGL
jgi:hypothetical protein